MQFNKECISITFGHICKFYQANYSQFI